MSPAMREESLFILEGQISIPKLIIKKSRAHE
jgi:hypothetical protein